jgi:tetratricopeptide (TPR) repeat protein
VLDQATAHQRLVVGLLREASGPAARQRLAFAAADITGLVAWMSFDLQELNASFAHYRAAATLAEQASAPGFLAWVLGSEALLMIHIGEDRQAIDVLSAADDVAARAGQSSTRAWLAAIACHTHARLGDGDAAWRSYGTAETFSSTQSEDRPDWLSFFHAAHVVSAAGRAHLSLGQARNASRALEKALAQHPPRLVRERGQFLGHLAEARLACGELEAACGLLGDAFDIATRTRSTRIASRIRDVRGGIPVRYRTAAVVRDLDERMRAPR